MAMEAMDNLEWLEAWYQRQCDGVWEHELGMNLRPVPQSEHAGCGGANGVAGDGATGDTSSETKDLASATSGWGLTIELTGTDAADSRPRSLVLDCRDGDWLWCAMTPDRFEGAGDARRLEQIIGVFRQWVDLQDQPRAPRLQLEVAAGD